MKVVIASEKMASMLHELFPRSPGDGILLELVAAKNRLTAKRFKSGFFRETSSEALVNEPGWASVPAKVFKQIVTTFQKRGELCIQKSGCTLQINSFTLNLADRD